MRSSRGTAGAKGGVTLAELIVATGLAAIVMTSLVSVTGSAIRLWTQGEATRDAREVSSAALGFLANDLRQLHATAEGDLVVDWFAFDLDRDGVTERLWPRLAFVRDASSAEVSAMARRSMAERARKMRDEAMARQRRQSIGLQERSAEPVPESLEEDDLLQAAGLTREAMALGTGGIRDVDGAAIVEVLYAVLPEGTEGAERYTGVLMRQERLHTAGMPRVLTEPEAFDTRGRPDLQASREIARGVLWFRPLMATQTTLIDMERDTADGGWTLTDGLRTAARSWDAWGRNRPDVELTQWNEPAPGMPAVGPRPTLPRVIRLEIESQRAGERARAPRLLGALEEGATSFEVTSGARLVDAIGRYVLVGAEWMRLNDVSGDRAIVRRGQRGTTPRVIPEGTPVLFGSPSVIEIPIRVHDDDWRLLPAETGGTR